MPSLFKFSPQVCAILQAFRWSRQHQQFCRFSSPFRLSLCPLLRLSSTSNSLADLAATGFSFLLYNQATMDPRTLITPGERYSCHLQCLIVSLLSPLVFILIVSRTGSVLSRLNSLTYKFPRFPLRNLCSLVTFAVPSLVFATKDTAYC